MVIKLGKALYQALVLEMMNSFELVPLKLELHFDHVVKDKMKVINEEYFQTYKGIIYIFFEVGENEMRALLLEICESSK